MGDISSPIPTERRSGIAIVRPKLYENTQQNRDTFKRWTKLHLRDTLSVPAHPDYGRVTRMLRYKRVDTNGDEEYLYTNHFEDLRLLSAGDLPSKTSQRLDLENVRALEEGEVAVLEEGDDRVGKEPIVFHIVDPSVGVFAEVTNVLFDRNPVQSYQRLPTEIATVEHAPGCTLVTLTMSAIDHKGGGDVDFTYTQKVQKLQVDVVDFLRTAIQKPVYTAMYQYDYSARPGSLPDIPKGQHGDGEWVICVLIGGNANNDVAEIGFEGVEGQVVEWEKRIKLNGKIEGLTVKTGIWRGDVFMS